MAIITEHRDVLDRLASALLEYETLDGENLERVFRGERPILSDAATEPVQLHAVSQLDAAA